MILRLSLVPRGQQVFACFSAAKEYFTLDIYAVHQNMNGIFRQTFDKMGRSPSFCLPFFFGEVSSSDSCWESLKVSKSIGSSGVGSLFLDPF